MRARSTASLLTLALVMGAWSCSHNTARVDESTASVKDTATVQNPPGYRGMERDTTAVPPGATSQPVDTFLQRQGTGAPQDTMGYGGLERDTTGQGQRETQTADSAGGRTVPGMAQQDSTSGMSGMDSSSHMPGMDSTGMSGMDSTRHRMSDTTSGR